MGSKKTRLVPGTYVVSKGLLGSTMPDANGWSFLVRRNRYGPPAEYDPGTVFFIHSRVDIPGSMPQFKVLAPDGRVIRAVRYTLLKWTDVIE